jgi:Zn-dependent protease with chaperone function
MDFFAAQDGARRRTRQLIWLFMAAVAALIGSIYLALMALFAGGDYGWWNGRVFAWVAGSVIVVVGLASLGKIAGLRAGGSAVAKSVGGRRLDPRTADPQERRLLNVVEEMAIASGVPVPTVYVLPEENTINAFAAGFTPDDAALGFTAGALRDLNRDELQGVVAHEFSHVLNGDMRLNIHLIGVLFGILVLSILGQGLLRASFTGSRRRDNKEGASIALVFAAVGLVLMLAGTIGVFFGRLIQSAVSRQREYLADAAAVQFTRNPDGLAGALRKIGGAGSRVAHPHSQDVAHLFFANGLRLSFGGWFATHPPLEDRIRALDPGWDGSFAKRRAAEPFKEEVAEAGPAAIPRAAGVTLLAGVLGAEALAKAERVRDDLERRCGAALHDPLEARALVFALLMADSLPQAHPVQLDYLRGSAGEELEEAVARRMRELETLPEEERLPLIDLVLPTLGLLDTGQRSNFLQRVRRLVSADGQITWFAFVTGWMIRRHLEPPEQLHPIDNPQRLAGAVSVLLAALASIDSPGEGARDAFQRAASTPGAFAGLLTFPEAPLPDYLRLEEALRLLGAATFERRKEVLEAAARVVMDDDTVSPAENELLRLTAAALDCPSPLAATGFA